MVKRLSNPQRDEWVKMMLHTKLSHTDRRSPMSLPASLQTLMRRGWVRTDGWASTDYGSQLQVDWILLAPHLPAGRNVK